MITGLKLKAFHIGQELKRDTPATVNFTADKAGKFTFRCARNPFESPISQDQGDSGGKRVFRCR
jgi:plastocyanin domain-containing protein